MKEQYIALDENNFAWSLFEVEWVTEQAKLYYPNIMPKSTGIEIITAAINQHRNKCEEVSELDIFLLVLDLADKGMFLD
ncbi:MAG: hypothetical protein LBV67_07095 [Streptococcaceae bacterium]|jgi:hypothetical protein|nr:hypothetical protein [Streptococcaceae bacterium]